jgi:tetratricopeptide (TPR) repeat protein
VNHIPEVDLLLATLTPDALPAERRAEIQTHLADCPECQSARDLFAASEDALEQELRDEFTWEPLVGSDRQRSLMRYASLVAEEDEEARELLKPFLANPVHVAWKTLDAKRFRTAGVVRTLIREAHAICHADALVAHTFAEAAIEIAQILIDPKYPAGVTDQLLATAWKERANSQMLLGRFPQAHHSLDTSERFHKRYQPNGLGLSIVALVRAGVFYEQQRLEEAITLARQAEYGFAHAGQNTSRMNALFLRASILFEGGRAAEAVPLFQQFVEFAEERCRAEMIGRGCYALGNCYVDLGNPSNASMQFHRALVLFREVGPEPERLKTQWGIARVVLHGGNYIEALRLLRDVSTEFERRQMVTDTALVGLDIMEALLAIGKPRRIVALAQHLFSVFTQAGMITGALAALAYLKEAAASGSLTSAGIQEVRAFLRKAERQPSLHFVPPPRTP